eukprot:6833176-Prymnesium_polylepis.1
MILRRTRVREKSPERNGSARLAQLQAAAGSLRTPGPSVRQPRCQVHPSREHCAASSAQLGTTARRAAPSLGSPVRALESASGVCRALSIWQVSKRLPLLANLFEAADGFKHFNKPKRILFSN